MTKKTTPKKTPATKPAAKKTSPLRVVRDQHDVPKVQRDDVAGPAAVRLPDGDVKMVDQGAADAVADRLAALTTKGEGKPAGGKLAPVKTEPPKDEPKAEPLGELETVQVEACILAAALHCAAKDDVRYYLNGVHLFEHREGVLRIESTNGHVLFVHDYPVEKVPAWAKGDGVIVDRAKLGKVIAAAGKDDGVLVDVTTGIGHGKATLATWPDQWASFKLDCFTNVKFPDTEKIAQGAAGTLAQTGDRTPLEATAIDPKYFKLGTDVATALGMKAVQAFMGDGKSAAVFTFGSRRAALYVMPMRDAGELSVQAATVLAPALRGSLGALKAHQTRNETAAEMCTDPEEAKKLREKAADFAARIRELTKAANEAKALPAPTKKAA